MAISGITTEQSSFILFSLLPALIILTISGSVDFSLDGWVGGLTFGTELPDAVLPLCDVFVVLNDLCDLFLSLDADLW